MIWDMAQVAQAQRAHASYRVWLGCKRPWTDVVGKLASVMSIELGIPVDPNDLTITCFNEEPDCTVYTARWSGPTTSTATLSGGPGHGRVMGTDLSPLKMAALRPPHRYDVWQYTLTGYSTAARTWIMQGKPIGRTT